MKKNNAMALTIIAVVTLLTAVVGATFAYFTFSATISSGTNTITATTGSVGNVTLTATNPAMHITTTAVDFKQGTPGTYWATITNGTAYQTTEETDVINTLAVTGGDSATVYQCTYTLGVVTTGLPASGMAASGEYVVYISGIGASTITLDMGTTANRSKSYTVVRYITGSTSATLSASAKLVNTSSEQDYLQDKTIVTTFTSSSLSCETVASAGTDSITVVSLPG